MLNNILVPLDGSPLSETALPYAEVLAQRTGASLTLVRAAHKPVSPLGDVAIDMQRAVMDAEDYLDSLSSQLAKRGFDVQTGVPFGGSAADWIIEEIDLRKVDLVVMATHDRIGPDRWVHGTIAETVVHRATVPVMLVRHVPGQSPAQAWNEPQPLLIVPLDGSELAEAALPSVKELARTLGARVVPGAAAAPAVAEHRANLPIDPTTGKGAGPPDRESGDVAASAVHPPFPDGQESHLWSRRGMPIPAAA